MKKRIVWLLVPVISVICIGAIVFSLNNHNSGSRYSVNQYGETYGPHDPDAGLENQPDLVAAVGDSGIEGYLKYSDIIGPSINSPEDATIYQDKKPSFLPLYDKDGKTMIDTFTLRSGTIEIQH